MNNLHDWIISLSSAIIGGFISWLITWRYQRTVEDAVKDDIQIKANDEIRKVFENAQIHFEPYSIRFVLPNPYIDYLVREIHSINDATADVSFVGVQGKSSQLMSDGRAVVRFSAIITVCGDDQNPHRERVRAQINKALQQ